MPSKLIRLVLKCLVCGKTSRALSYRGKTVFRNKHGVNCKKKPVIK